MLPLRFFLILSCIACEVAAQAYPVKVVRVIVPFPPSGGTDAIARIFAPALGEALGQQVLIDNRAGANGNGAPVSGHGIPAFSATRRV